MEIDFILQQPFNTVVLCIFSNKVSLILRWKLFYQYWKLSLLNYGVRKSLKKNLTTHQKELCGPPVGKHWFNLFSFNHWKSSSCMYVHLSLKVKTVYITLDKLLEYDWIVFIWKNAFDCNNWLRVFFLF